MDEDLKRFREAAARENRGRDDVRRRYSKMLQEQAIRYWMKRRRAGEGLSEVATVLGVAPWSLRRWLSASKPPARFQPVQIVPREPRTSTSLAVVMSASGPAWKGWTSRARRSCWRCCDEMARAARHRLRVRRSGGHAQRLRWIVRAGHSRAAARPVERRCVSLSEPRSGPHEGAPLGWDRPVRVREAPRTRSIRPAQGGTMSTRRSR